MRDLFAYTDVHTAWADDWLTRFHEFQRAERAERERERAASRPAPVKRPALVMGRSWQPPDPATLPAPVRPRFDRPMTLYRFGRGRTLHIGWATYPTRPRPSVIPFCLTIDGPPTEVIQMEASHAALATVRDSLCRGCRRAVIAGGPSFYERGRDPDSPTFTPLPPDTVRYDAWPERGRTATGRW